jgi:EAL domain-containing protein (putative c-di-GMP-specific phosphodiesterase class I)
VNLSRKQFQQPGLPQEIVELLTEWQIEPNCLQLEITEDAIAGELQLAVQRIKALKEHGVAVAIDNFGVGNSSFTALHRLPVDVLKIDPSLLIDLQHSQEAASLIHGLAVIVRNIGIRLVALGISESTQLIALQGLGCDYAQGRYLGSPMPSEQLAQYIDEQSVRTYGICGAAVMAEAWTERLPEIDPLIEQGR